MNKHFLFSLLFLLSLFSPCTWALSNCFDGEWLLDIKQSDNAQKIKDSLLRKYKQEQRASYRPDKNNDQEVNLPQGIPAFVFLTEPLLIHIVEANIALKQGGVERNINTQGFAPALSLKKMNNQGAAIVADWENKTLLIDTTTMDGTLVKEQYQLLSNDQLLVNIYINTKVSKPLTIKKTYQRQSESFENCIIPQKK